MIIGTFLRYYKTYQGINYVPITDQDKFCGLLGKNGIGKSSVLEALDTFFNARPWNFNTVTKKSGKVKAPPEIIPVFLLPRNLFEGEELKNAEILDFVARNISDRHVNSSNRSRVKEFIDHVNSLSQKKDISNLLIIPIGINHDEKISISFFNNSFLVDKVLGENTDAKKLSDKDLERFEPLLLNIKDIIDYIYIPKEIDPELFTKLETDEIQVLMGETLLQKLTKLVPHSKINEINSSLNSFITELGQELEFYSYRSSQVRQHSLRKNDVYHLIIKSFFSKRKLYKKQGDNWLEISALSSGEKQKAIINVVHNLLRKHRETGENLIVGIDEPESSLHMSACFDQFDALYEVSRDAMQVLFSSHWYGFLPTIENGSVTVILKDQSDHVFDMINLSRYREQIAQLKRNSRGQLPYDIRLKSINDFVQSVIISAIGDDSYNWIICEGSSDKLYLHAYLKNIVDTKLRIIPVGGAKEIKRLYSHLSTAYEDFKDEINGKIILLSDTDNEFVNYDIHNGHPKLFCKRIVNCQESSTTKVVNIDSNPIFPTEVEDVLNGKLFFEALKSFIDKTESLSFLNNINIEDITEDSSRFALDLKASEWRIIDKFFDTGDNKILFARKYTGLIDDSSKTPSWVMELVKMLEC